MQHIFSKRDQRKIQIIEYLIDYQQTTLKELCEECNLPIKTVWSDIKELNNIITPVSIDADQNGIYLHLPPAYSIRYIYIQLLHHSNEFTVLEYVFFNSRRNLEEIAEYIGLSVATLRRIITNINDGLEYFQATIKTNPVSIDGNYRNIIDLISYLLSEKYIYEEEYLQSSQEVVLTELFNSSSIIKQHLQNYPDYKKMKLWIYVRIVYYKSHPYIAEKPMLDSYVYNLFDFKKNHLAYKEFERVFEIEFTPEIAMFLFEVFCNKEHILSFDELSVLMKSKDSYYQFVIRIFDLLDRLASIYDITLDNKNELVIDICNTLTLHGARPYIIYNKRKTFIRELTHHHLLFYQTTKKLVKQIFGETLSDDKINEIIYIIITHWGNLSIKLTNKFQSISMAILMDTDEENMEIVKEILLQRMIYKIDVFKPSSLSLSTIVKELPKIDLLITNIPGLDDLECKVICIQDYPTTRDLIHVLESEEHIIRSKMSA
ncbi:helix-turn-helix domain-containing protein [Breznakia pachnodae]|uniref:DNA-binding Lrp family transcriptional regulator n=1 Tax=Breznakia pachnodae TaxID=265178 RepID=A0ABU0E4P7_9FIRM|nr:helix-turn-helix domain-containing protein [Breznakia pachnodae]MDQ0361877.1 DNA-binding Lrp family transcriptional regulator [Breznakia pachnodae]